MLGSGGCKAGHAEERVAFRSAPQLRFASAAPQNQSHSAKCTRPKICAVVNVQHSILPRASNSATSLPQLREINCTLQNALVEKICTVGCEVLRGVGT